ncbi:HD domain-containing protein [Gilliamella sp. B2776]|uniref:HD domain-containing protein n=1 Tax=unclassified Gilliamella TaxID=2685620 RepID=UPI00226ABC88|nr:MULTISPECIES: HD domain-containing protein [unclassified Gilliamella]MCX8650304.1 HD domain-containing protein [Gilliamella sp. B2779]MCX8654165.1 HD domain-containing protein [Gilliamella sp. B2737]MCX8655975.1 HD domain-containing protein [Gilliamella sp. B2894]MCX8664079.1 HD domain-containing protein [Gilliamella sp. B2887]MCX8692077.1 HD domain-containing protein [Gilliamella sp. B2776]
MSINESIELTKEQHQIVEKIQAYVKQKLANDFSGHDMAHIERVVRLAKKILPYEPKADAFIVILSAYLHDVIDEKVVNDVHQATEQLYYYLNSLNILDHNIKMIIDIIENMSFRKNLSGKKTLSLEGQIVQDADRLDAIGAIGIGRTFYYGGNKHNIMHDPTLLPRTVIDEESYRRPNTVINHFYEKLFSLKDRMNTEKAKKLALSRHNLLVAFVQQFEKEWQGED